MSPSSQDLAAQFSDLVQLAHEPGRVERTYLIGGLRVELAAHDVGLLDAFCRPMRHLQVEDGPADLQVELLARDETVGRVPTRWTWQVSRYADDRYEFASQAWFGALEARDRQTDLTVLVLDTSDPARIARPESSRPFLESLLARRGLVSVHGGTVGDDQHCILLAARGGSGKSSLVAHAVRRGLRTVGDDFLYLGPGPRLWSTYATVKLAPSSPSGGLVDPAVPVVDGKRLGWLPDIGPGCMAISQRPVAVVVPSVGERVSIRPIDVTAALVALLPSSAQLSSDRARTTRELTDLARSLPCFALTLAGDPDAELAALLEVAPELAPDGAALSADPADAV